MHIPDGFINGATSAGAAVVAAGGVGAALKAGARSLAERQIPLAGLAAAFIFALQMLNFPVAAGTSGHLLGGALAAVLLGPAMGVTVLTVVVFVQALLFADGGLSALGLNIINMGLITSLVGWLVFRALMAVFPKHRGGATLAAMIAAWASVVVSSIGFVIQYSLGGQGGVDSATVFAAMTGVHALIGIGEGLITGTVVAAVLAVRPDLVFGTARYDITRGNGLGRKATAGFIAAGLLGAISLVVFVAPLASSAPDGLERVAEDSGLVAGDSGFGALFSDYQVGSVEPEWLGTVVSGVVGLIVTFAVGVILVTLGRRRLARRA